MALSNIEIIPEQSYNLPIFANDVEYCWQNTEGGAVDISHLQEFLTFARYMNVSEAARQLHIAQSTLSNHIAAMEREFGCDLVSRGKAMRLTPAGRELVSYSSEIVGTYERMKTALVEAEMRKHTIVVALENAQNCSSMNFTRLATEFLTTGSGVRTQFHPSKAPVAHALLDEGADCVVTCMRPLQADIDAGVFHRQLPDFFPNRLFLWVSETNPLAQRASLNWKDLHGKYPMSTEVPLWASGCIQTLQDHNVRFEMRSIAEEGLEVLFAVKDDEVVLLDEQSVIGAFIKMIPGHTFIPIDEPDAICESHLAYYPDKVSPGLQLFLEYLDQFPS